ncbi:MAG: L-serine ammonia-lyase, iron-sulfur-dependent, subunit alpha [Trueperaceae bacterium]|nr:L-serine ammonia-lyase, iron-sulfur-dependent, subunit alpha [Trueperaceae bacterium]MCC6309693.1 L-serine ammonia-lyase, iron-sulfur-dependent, subunit alpha [Trueperaceae bacterium]MCO5173829.1 L-serine ammonia-lyase, iron-sulfur-dependent, subunit alpha [Trueperaceae bacterium]MCW5818943.1 L-serine ammonia-lyase, iron-sulfur-dependent, subunit alpha [Trueperaceae bacterium]
MTLADIMLYPGKASELVLQDDLGDDAAARSHLLTTMLARVGEMRDSIRRGLASTAPSRTGMVGWNAKTLHDAPDALDAPLLKRVQAYAMAVNEENARMGRIVAAPTAGSAGTVPGALIGVADHLGKDDSDLVMPLVLAAGIGQVISKSMFIAGSTGGCQAEIGSSAAMAAAAVTELLGGSARACVHAAAQALMNTIGLVCDPVGGYVEVPCVSRNAFYAVHAVSAAQLALAGVESFIPPDEVVYAMAAVGRMLPPELRETGEGGLADTPTGRRVALKMAR